MMENVIELKGVEKTYHIDDHELKILKKTSLSIKKGEFVAIVGPSGSGKSTLMHIMGALDRPTHGEVWIDGKNIAKLSDNELAHIRNKKIGFVFQSFNLMNKLTALENVMLPMWFGGRNDSSTKERATTLLKQMGLGHRMEHYPLKMSGGERQRVSIARSLSNSPSIILADEPTGNLDSKTGEAIMKILKDINKSGTTLIIVTHDLNIASTAQKRIVIRDGEIVKGGKT